MLDSVISLDHSLRYGLLYSFRELKTKASHTWYRFKEYIRGAYDAGRRDLNSVKSWNPKLCEPDQEYLQDYDLIRARSRDLYRNNSYGRAVINRFVGSVVGRGLKVQPSIDYKALGLTREEAIQKQEEISHKFHLWASDKVCDLRHKNNFYKLQSLAYRQMLKDGDVFISLPVKQERGSLFNTKINLINSMHVT